MRRVRLSTEASYEHLFSFGSTLTPWGELGLRHDGGDGETGAGLEVRAGLRYRYLPQGLDHPRATAAGSWCMKARCGNRVSARSCAWIRESRASARP